MHTKLLSHAVVVSLVGVFSSNAATLVSYWNFDESATGTGTTFDQEDSNDGTFEGTVIRTTGLIGTGAAQFNHDSSDGINVGAGTANNFSMSAGITVAALVLPDADLGNIRNEEIFRKEDGSNRILFSFQGFGSFLSLGLNTGGYSELDMPLDGLLGRPTLADLQDGNPHYLVGVHDAATGFKGIYVDGTLRFSETVATSISSGGTAPGIIGGFSGGTEPFNGVIDEVAIYDGALTASEIATHWANVQDGNNYFVPEPSAAAFVGLSGLLLLRRRRREGE